MAAADAAVLSGCQRHEHGAAPTFDRADGFKGARFASVDLSGAVFRDCDVSDVKISGSAITNFRLNGHGGFDVGAV